MSSKRAHTKQSVETDVLRSSMRRCALCYGIDNDFSEKSEQIAHVNKDSSDGSFGNLAWLCLNHHDRYDGQTSQSKGITRAELLSYRKDLYQYVANLRTDLASQYLNINVWDGEPNNVPVENVVISASAYQEHLIQQWSKYRNGKIINKVQNADRVTNLNRDTVTRVSSHFDQTNDYSELSGKCLKWCVLVINVGRVKTHDGEFIVVASQLVSGGSELEWYFDPSTNPEEIEKLECFDSMTARGVMSPKGFVTGSKILSIQKLTLAEANEFGR